MTLQVCIYVAYTLYIPTFVGNHSRGHFLLQTEWLASCSASTLPERWLNVFIPLYLVSVNWRWARKLLMIIWVEKWSHICVRIHACTYVLCMYMCISNGHYIASFWVCHFINVFILWIIMFYRYMENIVLVVNSLTVKCVSDTFPSETRLFLYIYRHFYFIWFFHIASTFLSLCFSMGFLPNTVISL